MKLLLDEMYPTANRRFPRSDAATLGRLVRALIALLDEDPPAWSSLFRQEPPEQ